MGQADGGEGEGGQLGAVQHLGQGGAYAGPQVVRVVLDPAGVGGGGAPWFGRPVSVLDFPMTGSPITNTAAGGGAR